MRSVKEKATTPKHGDLVVWWIPQVPMKSFDVPVRTLREAKLLLETLANYDLFQFDNKVKPDYCNAGGLNVWDATLKADDGSMGDWANWYSKDGEELEEVEDHMLDLVVWEGLKSK